MDKDEETIDASELAIGEIKVADIEAGHISIGIMSTKTGKRGVKHLYSDAYRERWPQDEYPELYQEDVPVD